MISLQQILSSPVAQRIGLGLMHSLWQCAGIAVLFAVVMVAMRNRRPQVRYNVALIALLLMVIIPAVTVFVADNDTITIGDAAKFEELEILVDTASSKNCQITFEYSTGIETWGTFSPTDGTNGFLNTGIIAWFDADIPSWATGTGTEYLIRLTRTVNGTITSPILDEIQVAAVELFGWDLNADLDISSAHFHEQADHPKAPAAAKGQLWVKSDTPNVLVFTDDAGTDTTLGAASPTPQTALLDSTRAPVVADASRSRH